MSAEDTTKTTESIHDELASFIDNIDAIIHSLPLTFSALRKSFNETKEEIENFIATHSIVLSKEEITFIEKEKISHPEETEEEVKRVFKLSPAAHKKFERLNRKQFHICAAVSLALKNNTLSLISEYDAFLGKLIKILYSSKPELFENSDRQISIAELLNFTTINEAKSALLDKEIEAILRKSHHDQFKDLEKKFNLTLTKNLECWPVFIELTQRRNLLAHCNGVASEQYIKICQQYKAIPKGQNVNVGDVLDIDPKYIANAYNCLYELAFKLTYTLWSKTHPNQKQQIDDSLMDLSFNALERGQYKLAKNLFKFLSKERKSFFNDVHRRVLVINYAITLHLTNHQDQCVAILDEDDWSSCDQGFKLAVHVLKEEYVQAAALMKHIGAKANDSDYLTWPLYKRFRETDVFNETFKAIFEKEPEIIEHFDEPKGHSGKQEESTSVDAQNETIVEEDINEENAA